MLDFITDAANDVVNKGKQVFTSVSDEVRKTFSQTGMTNLSQLKNAAQLPALPATMTRRIGDVENLCFPQDVTFKPYMQIFIYRDAESKLDTKEKTRGDAFAANALSKMLEPVHSKLKEFRDESASLSKASTQLAESSNAISDKIGDFAVQTVDFAKKTAEAAAGQFTRKFIELKESIVLPMPTVLEVGATADWASTNMNLAGGVLDQQTMDSIGQGMDNMKEFSSSLAGQVAARTAMESAASALGAESGIKFVEKASGVMFNPRPTKVFNGMSTRTFSFEYVFSPRNPYEASQVKKIIQKLRLHMHPEFARADKTYLRYPSEFKLVFNNAGGGANTSLPSIKQCALTDFNVKYAASNGQWTFLQWSDEGMLSQLPPHIAITLSFTEFDPLTKEDILKGY